MSLIDSLRSWGESLFTTKKAYIAQQSSPQSTPSSTIECVKGTWGQATSPIDGYANIYATNGASAGNLFLQSNERKCRLGTASSGDAGLIMSVSKGEAISYWVDTMFENCSISYFKKIGGGLIKFFKVEVIYAFA